MNANTKERRVDQNELRTNSFLVVVVLLTAYVTDRWELVAFQSAVFLLTSMSGMIAPYFLIYRLILRPLGIIKPDWRADNMEPHNFTAMFGTVVCSAATYCLYSGYAAIGWGVVWLITGLAIVAYFGWCAGCFAYYMIQKIGIKGFFRYAPIAKGFPGVRPPKRNALH